jgi:hypothetical protein
MRQRMIRETSPVAMACIGGMEGLEEEVEIFRDLGRGAPIFIFGETGGAAALLAGRSGNEALRVIDREILERLEPLRHSHRPTTETRLAGAESERPLVPYPLIAQALVEELIHLDDSRRR